MFQHKSHLGPTCSRLGITWHGGIQLTGLVQVRGAPGTRRSRAVQARLVATASRWDRLGPVGLRVDDEVAVADRLVPDGELEDAVEHHAAAVRSAAVEAEGELVEVALQVGLVDRALVGAQQPALGEGGDAVYPGRSAPGSSPRARAARWLRRSRV